MKSTFPSPPSIPPTVNTKPARESVARGAKHSFGTFNERSIADTAANAAPAGLPPCPLVVGDPLVADEDIC